MVESPMAKRPDFQPEEIELLRAYARKLIADNGWTGKQLGARMGVEQQNANAFTKANAIGGIGRITANSLASSQGFRDAEQLLIALKADEALAGKTMGNVWSERDCARRIAEAMGVSSKAIDVVVAHRKSTADAKRPVKWWVMQFVQQETQMIADGEV